MNSQLNSHWARLLKNSGALHASLQKSLPRYLQNYITAGDIVSETLQFAQAHPEQWKEIPEGEIIFYLRRVARNISLNHNRKYRHRGRSFGDGNFGEERIHGAEGRQNPSPSRAAHLKEKSRAVAAILGRLHQTSFQDVLKLVWLEGLSIRQAAERLQRTQGATKVLLFRAMRACREIARRSSFAGFRVSGETH